mmetsp:Transcript_266/g.610  ORF Transcript_266/g.610 Transcript_266/m.610 type:complete len:212 (-) Transcript_266:139-774(-)
MPGNDDTGPSGCRRRIHTSDSTCDQRSPCSPPHPQPALPAPPPQRPPAPSPRHPHPPPPPAATRTTSGTSSGHRPGTCGRGPKSCTAPRPKTRTSCPSQSPAAPCHPPRTAQHSALLHPSPRRCPRLPQRSSCRSAATRPSACTCASRRPGSGGTGPSGSTKQSPSARNASHSPALALTCPSPLPSGPAALPPQPPFLALRPARRPPPASA